MDGVLSTTIDIAMKVLGSEDQPKSVTLMQLVGQALLNVSLIRGEGRKTSEGA